VRADIINQQALLELSLGKSDEALKKVRKTCRYYKKTHNDIGLAFSLQLEGEIAFKREHYRKAVSVLRQAADLYLQHRNYTAYAESAYSAANALCKLGKYAAAEDILQRLLRVLMRHDNAFHKANIYSLLGLINMEKDNLMNAERWLKKSLDLERKDKRYAGAAADAINLAIIKQLQGTIELAHQYSEKAFDFAKKTDDKEFIELIKNKMLH
jgi:tetratricopeptide (TPR) repeat protein